MAAAPGLPAEARIAAYYAPDADDPLWIAGSAWLGRDATGTPCPASPNLPLLRAVTHKPRLYGFHATLKAPFRRRPGVHLRDVATATRALCRAIPPFALPRLSVAAPGGYLALVAQADPPPLRALADRLVERLDPLRAPLSPQELARRRAPGLNEAQETMLTAWGYPDVFALWRFHMTLTRRLTQAEAAVLHPAAQRHFAGPCAQPRSVTSIGLFVQPARNAPFTLAERIPLGG